jgi:hypothetical protein
MTIVDRLDIFMLGYPPHCQMLAAENRWAAYGPASARNLSDRQYAVIDAVCNSTIAVPADL